jgi:hypothetical protein
MEQPCSAFTGLTLRSQEVAMRTMVLLGAGVGLCACTDTSIIHRSYYNSAYTPSHVQLAAASGTALAVIRNDPFPTDRDNAGVLAAMQGRNFGPRLYFSQTPRPEDIYGYKVVMSFGDQGGYREQCTATPTPPSARAPTGPISVTAAFCIGELLLTDATGSISGAAGPDDPLFRRLIGDVMVALTPPYDPNRGNDREWPD